MLRSVTALLISVLVALVIHGNARADQNLTLDKTTSSCGKSPSGTTTINCTWTNATCKGSTAARAGAGGSSSATCTTTSSGSPAFTNDNGDGTQTTVSCAPTLTVKDNCVDPVTAPIEIVTGPSPSPGGGIDLGNCPDGFRPNQDEGCNTSPIIIDTNGTGFQLTNASDGVKFDIRGDGHPIKIGWTALGSHNAFLALDRDHNGAIDSGNELFGNFTQQPQSHNPNGFLALAEFDKPENGGNGDGIIDQRDAVFSHLVLWIDENHDGVSQLSELHPLPELGVYSLDLQFHASGRVDEFGNFFRFRAKVNPDREEGRSEAGRWVYDVFLTTH